jgi:hypothetical protein
MPVNLRREMQVSEIQNVDMSAKADDRAMAAWNKATKDAIVVDGATLFGGKENEKTLDALIGVPFVVVESTFRKGDIIPVGHKVARDYVSIECLIHPDFQSRFPRDKVVVNDGSTGIYRQIVAGLADQGELTVPDTLPEEGAANATRYDVSFTEKRVGPDGETSWSSATSRCPIMAPEGLRKSVYPNPDGSKATTWYLA